MFLYLCCLIGNISAENYVKHLWVLWRPLPDPSQEEASKSGQYDLKIRAVMRRTMEIITQSSPHCNLAVTLRQYYHREVMYASPTVSGSNGISNLPEEETSLCST